MTNRKIVSLLACWLVAASLVAQDKQAAFWGNIDYEGNPWVKNASKKISITQGLRGRHVALWASHGRYYDQEKGLWKWQRPDLFRTTEDLFTQTIVVPYLMPMLENAGAIVFSPRERDWQRNEVIVDNDDKKKAPHYMEINMKRDWTKAPRQGFAQHGGVYRDGENPFEAGTARMCQTTSKESKSSEISYQPSLPESGRYAVYVSYQTLPGSIDDAQYIVYHRGQKTEFRVNQRMGGGTWVYLGTFDFDGGCDENNRVVLTNLSKKKGFASADAVRFGGGMGNITRGGSTSRLPRALEGARYYAQWAGTPYKYYSTKNGQNDYGDDINVRSLMTNWLAGGSAFVPGKEGLGVPIELSLAVHSDAGVNSSGIVGSLAICTTDHNDGKLNSGVSRSVSYDFAKALLEGLDRDLRYKYQRWNKRYLWDRNYSETRLPEVPSAIIETLSHQNMNDMKFGHDPNFKFTLARSLYKTILRYVNGMHGEDFTVQPLAPDHFAVELKSKNKVRLTWQPVKDPQEKTATPTSYMLYTAIEDGGFDNGQPVKGNACTVKITPGLRYNFKVTAVNKGGESFPTPVLSAISEPDATKTILIINGFNRLSAPAITMNDSIRGFDLKADPGVSYGRNGGWNADLEGKFIAGNDFNYVATHAAALQSAHKYNIASCNKEAVEMGYIDIMKYHAIDLVLGLEKNDGHSLQFYKTFTDNMQKQLSQYLLTNGRLMVSGAYVGSDMRTEKERRFMANMLKLSCDSINVSPYNIVQGLGQEMNFYRTLNETHYAATATDILDPAEGAFTAMTYANGTSAAIAFDDSSYKTFVMGFPFECITDSKKRAVIMKGIMNFLLK